MFESPGTVALRGINHSVRGVIMASNDALLMQTIDVRALNGEYITGIERPQVYGFNSVPVPPDNNGGKAAEAVIGFRDGNRAHPYIISEGDRRSRPKNWQPGDAGTWHYQGATQKFTQTGFVQDAGPNKQPSSWTVGQGNITLADTKFTSQIGGSKGPACIVKAAGVFLGGDPDVLGMGAFDFVMTASGQSKNVYALKG